MPMSAYTPHAHILCTTARELRQQGILGGVGRRRQPCHLHHYSRHLMENSHHGMSNEAQLFPVL